MFAAFDESSRSDAGHDGLAPTNSDAADVRIVLTRLDHANQVEPALRSVAGRHVGRRTYAVIASLPIHETELPDVLAAARRHAFMVVVPAALYRARTSGRLNTRDSGLLVEVDLAHAVTGTMQWLRRGDAMVVLCGCEATLALARRAVRHGHRWRASFDRPESGDLSNVPSDPAIDAAVGAWT